jgi:hypothetical protein
MSIMLRCGTSEQDPGFVSINGTSAADFDITESSPARDAGTSITGNTLDFLNRDRPDPSGLTDIGAFEYGSTGEGGAAPGTGGAGTGGATGGTTETRGNGATTETGGSPSTATGGSPSTVSGGSPSTVSGGGPGVELQTGGATSEPPSPNGGDGGSPGSSAQLGGTAPLSDPDSAASPADATVLAGDEGGCGCRVGGGRSRALVLWAGLLLALGLARRRARLSVLGAFRE